MAQMDSLCPWEWARTKLPPNFKLIPRQATPRFEGKGTGLPQKNTMNVGSSFLYGASPDISGGEFNNSGGDHNRITINIGQGVQRDHDRFIRCSCLSRLLKTKNVKTISFDILEPLSSMLVIYRKDFDTRRVAVTGELDQTREWDRLRRRISLPIIYNI